MVNLRYAGPNGLSMDVGHDVHPEVDVQAVARQD
jgi:hypothetical protein